MINRFFHLTAIVLLASCFLLAQTKSESGSSAAARRAAEIGTGKWWIGLTDQSKDKFIERYTKAMDHVMNDLATECSQGMRSLLDHEMPRTGVDEVDIMSNFTLCEVASSFDFGYGTHQELREGVDAFYKDSRNLSVRIQVALQRVRDVLAAKHPRGTAGIG
ncbi:MAG TPA: hypothetical protein VGS05_18960 [Candidatus Sulfotelmatobacter sp.]|nr:hypothetical protein [Candidatus Sulfotelmatobacter sp.]